MNKHLTNKKLIAILISVIAISALIALSLNRSSNVNPAQQAVNDVTALAGRLVKAPVHAVQGTFDAVDNLIHTYEENKQLKSKVNQTEELQAQLLASQAEQDALEEELALSQSLSDYEKIHSTVISRNPDRWIDQLVVDRGSEDGVELGMAVMSQNGLIGRVVEVSPLSSKVGLMTTEDQRENLVSAEVHRLEDSEDEVEESEEQAADLVHGVVEGYDAGSNRLIMEQISSETDLVEGQKVYTSGLSDKTPRSLLIGQVDEVVVGDFGLTQRVYIKPASDFNDIRYVTIIKRLAEDKEEDRVEKDGDQSNDGEN